jgi:Domain of unknown function (DUF4288)
VSESSFVATLLFRSQSSDESYQSLFDETIAIILATDIDAARQKAVAQGAANETSFKSVDGTPIVWLFQELIDIRPTLTDGMCEGTVMSRHFHDLASYKSAFES